MAAGDHLKVRRHGGLYSHHGIDMGDGTVVHLSGEPFRTSRARICRVPREEFLREGEAKIVAYGEPTLPEAQVLANAESLLDGTGYDLFRYNCEHFAHFCKTGNCRSRQIERLARGACIAAGVAFTLSTAVVAVLIRQRLRPKA